MASIHRRPDSQYWHAAYIGPDGRRILRSTKQQDRQSALAVAMEYERASKLARRGELVEAQAREVLKDIMKRADMGETMQTVSIKSHFDTWLASKRDRKSEGTGERYGVAVEDFLKTLGNRANKNLASLTAADVQRFLDHRTAKGLAPKTVNVDVKIIRGALNAARRQGLIPTNPAEAVELPEAIGMERGTFTPAEVKMLVDTAEGEWKLLIMLAYFTGARLSDCCRMQWEDVDLTEETLTYTQTKTGAKVTAPLHPDLLARLNKLAGTDKPEVFILPHMANLRPGGRHGLSETFKKIMRKAGVDSQTVKGAGNQMFSRRSFHALRHSFTSALANQNVSSELRMKLTGHKTEGEHRKYTHHEMDNLRAAIKKNPVAPLNLISARRTLSNKVDIADNVIHIGLTMKTATVRDLRNRFPRVAAWIDEGEPVEITKSGKPFARLVPTTPEKPRRFKMPDIKARLERTFGDRVYSAEEVARMRAAELEGEEG